MKRITFLICACLTIIFTGCLPTLYPLYKDSDLIFKQELVGDWMDKHSLWSFSKDKGNSYKLSYKDCNDPINTPEDYSTCTMADFDLHLLQLGEGYFIDFYPRNFLCSENKFFNMHIRPMHTFSKLEISENELKIYMLDVSWFEKLIKQNAC